MTKPKKKPAKKPKRPPKRTRISKPKRKAKPLPRKFRKPIDLEYAPLAEVKRWPRNPKDHDEAAIKESFERFGFVAPIQRDEKSGELVAGHGRIDALIALKEADAAPPRRIVVGPDGEWWVPVIIGVEFVNLAEAHAYAVADNRTSEIGGWKKDLANVLQELQEGTIAGLKGIGYSQADMDRMLKRLNKSVEDSREGENPKTHKTQITCPKCGHAWDGRNRSP